LNFASKKFKLLKMARKDEILINDVVGSDSGPNKVSWSDFCHSIIPFTINRRLSFPRERLDPANLDEEQSLTDQLFLLEDSYHENNSLKSFIASHNDAYAAYLHSALFYPSSKDSILLKAWVIICHICVPLVFIYLFYAIGIETGQLPPLVLIGFSVYIVQYMVIVYIALMIRAQLSTARTDYHYDTYAAVYTPACRLSYKLLYVILIQVLFLEVAAIIAYPHNTFIITAESLYVLLEIPMNFLFMGNLLFFIAEQRISYAAIDALHVQLRRQELTTEMYFTSLAAMQARSNMTPIAPFIFSAIISWLVSIIITVSNVNAGPLPPLIIVFNVAEALFTLTRETLSLCVILYEIGRVNEHADQLSMLLAKQKMVHSRIRKRTT